MLSWFNRIRGGSKAATRSVPHDMRGKPWLMRSRWGESAETNRVNGSHWQQAAGRPLNEDLVQDLDTLRSRCELEIEQNPTLSGIVDTYVAHLLGSAHPKVECKSEASADWSRAAEQVWKEWWSSPDITGEVSGSEKLEQWVRSCFSAGDFLEQLVTDSDAKGVQTRLHGVHARRLKTPSMFAGDNNIVMGVRVNRYGKPLKYYVDEPYLMAGAEVENGRFSVHDPKAIVHGFVRREPGQVRGVPWFAGVLQTSADLRDFDQEVLDAVRAAAEQGVLLYSEHHDAPFLNINEEVEYERHRMKTMPPGWRPVMMKSEQPASGYLEYRADRQRDLGRPISMPLMMIRLDSSGHNYSSARFDAQVYFRQLRRRQAWLSKYLGRLFWLVIREAEVAGILPARPKDASVTWIWPPDPQIDPVKEASANKVLLETGQATLTEIIGARGVQDLDDHVTTLAREDELLARINTAHPRFRSQPPLQQSSPEASSQ